MDPPVVLSLELLKLFGGLVYLLVGGDILVRGALGFAKRAGVPPLIIGLTIVALGTSAPEFMVSLFAALDRHGDIAIGNVVGSNIANVLVVLGLAVLVFPARTDEAPIGRESTFLVLLSAVFVGLCFLQPLRLLHGIFLLTLLGIGWYITLRGEGAGPWARDEEEFRRVLGLPSSKVMIVLFLVLGIVMLPVGANLTVEGAVAIASSVGVSEAVIGLTIVAVGTSLPELSTTLIGVFHKSSGVALGNVVGSNIVNIAGIVGLTSVITPVPISEQFLGYDLWVMFAVAVLMWIYATRVTVIGRVSGGAFVAAYALYVVGLLNL